MNKSDRDAIRSLLETLTPWSFAIFGLPEQSTQRRKKYRQIAGIAHSLFGPGQYSIRMLRDDDGTRLPQCYVTYTGS